MPIKNTRDQWGSVSKSLHWLIVLLLVWMAWLGLTMGDLPRGPDKIASYALHKSVGISILVLVLARIGWRWHAGAPGGLPGTPRWQERIAALTHWGLYALVLAIPLSGWILNSASGFPLQWFGLFNLPALADRNPNLQERAADIHRVLFWVLVALVAVHAAAAFYHHLFLRDATLSRMLPGRKRGIARKQTADA